MKLVVVKSQGQLVDLAIVNSEDEELLLYVAERYGYLCNRSFMCLCSYAYNYSSICSYAQHMLCKWFLNEL